MPTQKTRAPRKGAGKVSNTKVSSFSSHEIMVEGAAGLDYIDKVAKRAVEIIFHAEWMGEERSQIAWTLGTVGIESV